jgi:protein-S-isoprenylcysteine O-methyltransferase Ste14
VADETFYRILFIGVYAFFLSIRGYYRFVKPRQSKPDTVEERKEFGKMEALMSFSILSYFASVVLYLFDFSWFSWTQIVVYPEIIRWIGVGLALASVPFLGWIHRTLDRQYSACLQIKESHLLIKEGPYSRVRHPMYTVLNSFSFGISLVTANFLIIGFAILVILPFPFVAKKEERMLLDTFGDEYAEYMEQTGRFFPKLRQS